MRTSHQALTGVLAVGLLLGCRKNHEPELRQELTQDGLTEIKITRAKDGRYEYTAENQAGELCTGGRRYESSFGAETSSGGQVCEDGAESDPGYEPRNRRACDRGGAAACGRLGALLGKSAGTAEQARAVLKKGCDGQNYQACGNLAILLAGGKGGPADLAGARGLLKTACDQGASHCGNLAIMLIQGEGGPRDPVEARTRFAAACAVGDLQSCHNLGVALLKGEGGPKDLPGAREAFDKACKGKYEDACALGEKLQAALAK